MRVNVNCTIAIESQCKCIIYIRILYDQYSFSVQFTTANISPASCKKCILKDTVLTV